jgi:NAD(P)-dependent dehydrogenase (short-subunit alcohol dehydrogenase family)
MQVLVTGVHGGIGSAISNTLKGRGDQILGVGREDADLSKLEGVEALATQSSISAPFEWIVCSHGFIDSPNDFLEQDPALIRQTFEINTLSCIYITQLLFRQLKPGGGIIYISSTSGLWGNGNWPVYSASKGAVNIFAQAMARKYRDFNFIVVCPGPTTTPMLEKSAGKEATGQDPHYVAEVIAAITAKQSEYRSGDVLSVRNGEAKIVSRIE